MALGSVENLCGFSGFTSATSEKSTPPKSTQSIRKKYTPPKSTRKKSIPP